MAVFVDGDTVYVDGEVCRRDHAGEEVLLQPMTDAKAPRLRCSNCGFERGYTFWYKRIGFVGRLISYCPGCGYKIMGVVSHE